MTTTAQLGTLLTIGDADFKAGYLEARSPHFADCGINTEQRLRHNSGFILGLLRPE